MRPITVTLTIAAAITLDAADARAAKAGATSRVNRALQREGFPTITVKECATKRMNGETCGAAHSGPHVGRSWPPCPDEPAREGNGPC